MKLTDGVARVCCHPTHKGGYMWNRNAVACGKPAKIEHDGKLYCGIHDPERIAARLAERDALWAAQDAERNARANIARLRQQLADAVLFYTEPLPEPIASWRDAVLDAEQGLE